MLLAGSHPSRTLYKNPASIPPNSNAAGTHAARNAANVRKTHRHTTTPAAPGILLPLELFTDGTSRQRGILFSPQKLNFERKKLKP